MIVLKLNQHRIIREAEHMIVEGPGVVNFLAEDLQLLGSVSVRHGRTQIAIPPGSAFICPLYRMVPR